MGILESLKPASVFYFFEEICKIPHGSGNEKQLSDYLKKFAEDRNLFCIQDEWNNIIIIKEATEGYEDVEPLILQGHMDMVAVAKPGSGINMEKEPLKLQYEGDYVWAEDTSLGGDDGIAVAYIMAIMDAKDIAHPRIEAIITVDEERGLNGAKAIDLSALKGRRMLNLDNEEEGVLLTSCAGGASVKCTLPIMKEKQEGSLVEVTVKGLKGGHSGTEINKNGGNAIQILARVLDAMWQKTAMGLVDLEGGAADNAIPTNAVAYLWVPQEKIGNAIDVIHDVSKEIKEEYRKREPELSIVMSEVGGQQVTCVKQTCMDKVIAFLAAFPTGVQTMSMDVEGLVESSLNMGILKMNGKEITVTFSVRSSVGSAKEAIIRRLYSVCQLAGAHMEVSGEYPGWAYKAESPLRDTMVRVYEEMFGRKPKVEAIHAGLECGLFTDKIPGLDCISYGPDMMNIHSIQEKLCISSVERVWNYLLEILKQK